VYEIGVSVAGGGGGGQGEVRRATQGRKMSQCVTIVRQRRTNENSRTRATGSIEDIDTHTHTHTHTHTPVGNRVRNLNVILRHREGVSAQLDAPVLLVLLNLSLRHGRNRSCHGLGVTAKALAEHRVIGDRLDLVVRVKGRAVGASVGRRW
jgi:hypothetical protein